AAGACGGARVREGRGRGRFGRDAPRGGGAESRRLAVARVRAGATLRRRCRDRGRPSTAACHLRWSPTPRRCYRRPGRGCRGRNAGRCTDGAPCLAAFDGEPRRGRRGGDGATGETRRSRRRSGEGRGAGEAGGSAFGGVTTACRRYGGRGAGP